LTLSLLYSDNNFDSLSPAGESSYLFGSHHYPPFADNSRQLLFAKICLKIVQFWAGRPAGNQGI